jgi:1-phosphatidylinositol-4-phosphate 5-kinase
MLPKYYKHMKRHARHSLLTRFCGMYTVKLRDMTGRNKNEEQRYTFVIMNSVFPAEASRFLSETFDLKGSTVGRECSPEEKTEKGHLAVLKDLDLAREVQFVKRQSMMQSPNKRPNNYGIHVGPSCKSKLLAQLRKDVAFLQECRVMDYSLLVGVVNMEPTQPTRDVADDAAQDSTVLRIQPYEEMVKARRRAPVATLFRVVMKPAQLLVAPPLFFTRKLWAGVRRTMSTVLTYPLPHYGSSACVVDGGALSVVHGTRSGKHAIYYMGLIDFLQPWTARKVAEKQLKGMLGYDTSAISCVDPDEYASRFLDFIDTHVS